MPNSRSRFSPLSLAEHVQQSDLWLHSQHEDDTPPEYITWTSKGTLTTDLSTPMYPHRAGQMTAIRASVAGAPVTNPLKYDLHLDGISIFDSGELPTIAATLLFGKRKPITRKLYFYTDTKMQFKVDTISSATGPIVIVLEFIPGF